ncbi:MAG: hypothetical protein H0X66_14365 [Verrucomicrobia bacterium]|nr:hypothetical protein [Verrucomicrobiota bacterium]
MNVFRSSGFILALLSAAILCVACGSNPNRQNTSALASARAQIYDRATVQFEEAAFFKPNDSWADEIGVTLAPLLMQEVKGSEPTRQQFGSLTSDGRKLAVDTNNPTLYFRKDKIWLKGMERDQVAFLWFHNEANGIVPQGVRITLDADGHPALWEILHDTSGVQQVFASQSLEAAASAQFGAPLPGRRSALEQSVADAPQVAVSRVISDGPLVMGPAIYLNAGNHDVATLICRCMPPQVSELVSSSLYDIADMSDPATERLVKQALRTAKSSGPNWLNEGAEETEMRLRLPDRF